MTAPFRVLVTGSREGWTDVHTVVTALTDLYEEIAPRSLVVVHGACPDGIDAIADLWVTMRPHDPRVSVERWPADWRAGHYAGPARNSRMVAAGADRCLVFAGRCRRHPLRRPHPSHGTADCADKALAAGIPVDPYGPFAARWQQQTLEAL